MKKINKRARIIVAAALLLAVCVPCGFLIARWTSSQKAEIVVTMFALYDWTRQVLGSNPANLHVKYLMENGVDPHNYEPGIQDTAGIIQSRLFIYIGEAETKVTPILQNNQSVTRRDLAIMNIAGGDLYEHERDEHDCDADCDHGHSGDEHVWLSLRFAQRFVTAIAIEVARLDANNADYYRENARRYNEKLALLDSQYGQAFANGNGKPILFADRFPFIYMLQDYSYATRHTHWIAPWTGCGAITDPPMHIKPELESRIRQFELDYIFTLENSTLSNFAQSIAADSGRNPRPQVLVLNSIQSVTARQVRSSSYIGIMTDNLANLKKALGVT